MNQSNNTQKNLKPKNQKKYTEAVNLGHRDFWLFTVRFITPFVWVDIYFGQRIIGC